VVDPSRIAEARLSELVGEGFRHLSPRHDPLSGEGARLHGGRFNPPGSFPVLYVCRTRACVAAELRELGKRQAIGVDDLLPRYLYHYEVSIDRVLDLTDAEVQAELGLSPEILTGSEWRTCQDLGATAHSLGARAILSPSATGVDEVLAVFLQNLGPGRLDPQLVEEWRSVDDLASGDEKRTA